MPSVTLRIEDRSGNVTEFVLGQNMTTPSVIETAPKLDTAIRTLVMWKEWCSAFLKVRLEDAALAAIVQEKRNKWIQEQAEFEAKKKEQPK